MARPRRLILVRHAQVELLPDRPAPEWPLTAEGRAAAGRLAALPLWDGVVVVASSPEGKAVGTAEPIAERCGVQLRIELDLREAARPAQPVVGRDEYVALVTRYLSGGDVEGWEPAEDVRARIAGCVRLLLGDCAGDVVVVSHGLALSLMLGLGAREWSEIGLPAVAVADDGLRLVSAFA